MEEKTIESRLNDLFDKHEEQRNKIDALLNAEEPKPTLVDKLKAIAFPCMSALVIFFGARIVGQMDDMSKNYTDLAKEFSGIKANVDMLMHVNKLGDRESQKREKNVAFYPEAEHSKTILLTEESTPFKN